jgi:hypothetical protein
MKTYEDVEANLRKFLTSILDVHEWSASRADCFIPVLTGRKSGWALMKRTFHDLTGTRNEGGVCVVSIFRTIFFSTYPVHLESFKIVKLEKARRQGEWKL